MHVPTSHLINLTMEKNKHLTAFICRKQKPVTWNNPVQCACVAGKQPNQTFCTCLGKESNLENIRGFVCFYINLSDFQRFDSKNSSNNEHAAPFPFRNAPRIFLAVKIVKT